MCLVTAPTGRRYEWLNHETWMSLRRQYLEIPRSLMPNGGGTTTASAASQEVGDHVALIDGFVDARCDLIVTIGAEMGEATTASARQHPDVNFIGIDQHHDEELPNLAGLVFPEDHAGFLVGALAASATVTGIVAVVLDSGTEPTSVAYGDGFANGVVHVDPDVEVLSIVHPGDGGEPDADWGATAAREALDAGADVVFGPGSGSGRGVLLEVAGTGFDGRNGALCIGAEVDDFLSLLKARRCLLTSVLKLPNEFHDMYWVPGRPAVIKQFEDALNLPTEYESERSYSTLTLINREFFLGGTPSGGHVGPVGLGLINRWGAHKVGVPNRTFLLSDDLKSALADLTAVLWTGEVPTSATPTTTTAAPTTTTAPPATTATATGIVPNPVFEACVTAILGEGYDDVVDTDVTAEEWDTAMLAHTAAVRACTLEIVQDDAVVMAAAAEFRACMLTQLEAFGITAAVHPVLPGLITPWNLLSPGRVLRYDELFGPCNAFRSRYENLTVSVFFVEASTL